MGSKARARRERKKLGEITFPSGKVASITPEVENILLSQEQKFREKFGREMGPGDPAFFDPDFDTPTTYSVEKLVSIIREAAIKAGQDPDIAEKMLREGKWRK